MATQQMVGFVVFSVFIPISLHSAWTLHDLLQSWLWVCNDLKDDIVALDFQRRRTGLYQADKCPAPLGEASYG